MSSNSDISNFNKENNFLSKPKYFENNNDNDGQTPSNTPSNKKGEKLQFDMSKFNNVYDKLNKLNEESDNERDEEFEKQHMKFNKNCNEDNELDD